MRFTKEAALDFIVGQIVEEAARQGEALSDIERQVLYFSESPHVRPGMIEVMETFERDYDDQAFEHKIASLLREAHKRTCSTEEEVWRAAIRSLKNEDVYLGVMLDQAGPFRPAGDFLMLVAAATVVSAGLACYLLFVKPTVARYLSPEQQGFYLWLSAVVVVCLYTTGRWIFGTKAVDSAVGRAVGPLDRVVRILNFRREGRGSGRRT